MRQYCARFATEAVILVVANGCTDNTVSIVRAMQDRYANLELIEIAGRIGKGGAVRAGLWIGLEEFVAFVDADGSTSADEFARLYQLLDRSDDDAIIGSRWLRGARIEQRQPLTRRIASRGFNVSSAAKRR
ncbi:MAG: glycosyltransferase, partial [Candidatus Baltobacteraceae bacterium]